MPFTFWGHKTKRHALRKTIVCLAFLVPLSVIALRSPTTIIERLVSWEVFFFFGFSITIVVSFYFYLRSQRQRMLLHQKGVEQEITQYYLNQLEQQQLSVRRFQHDQQNILFSIEGYLTTGNITGLKNYFYSQIKTATESILHDNFTLDHLANIHVPEIKATLAGKLMTAQNAGISVTFEVSNEIDHTPVDSLAIVRMFGIILDNAIEELTALGGGQLTVACYKIGNGISFVVENTCRANIPKLRELEQVGFSTKGAGRGLGLSNLAKIAAAHPDQITLQTTIRDGNFTQKLRIGEKNHDACSSL